MCATKKLSEICEIVNWWTPDTWNSSYWDGDILWITPKDMWKLEDIYVSDTFRKITEQWLKNSSAKIFPQNSIILSSRAPIWHLAINTVPMCTNQGCKWLIPWKDLDAKYSYYFLLNSVDLLNSLWTGTTFKELSSTKLKEIQIPLPPLSTQASIVARLDSAMSEIDEARRQVESALASVREVWESTLESVFVGGGEWWEEKRLREIATFRNWMNFTKWSKWEKLKIVGVKDFQKNFWIPFENLESVIIDGKLNEIDILKKGDILAVRSNGNPALIGRTILAWPTWDNICHSGFTIRIRINRESISPVYLCHFLKTQKAKSELIESGTGINIKSLNQQALSILLIPFPPLPEQSRIVAHLDAVRAETESLERLYREKLASLDELRRSVLAEAFL